MARKQNDCSPETDELIKEFCRENDVGKMAGCPKCGMTGKDLMLCFFCQHEYCPIREWDRKSRP
jgi:hypothetical protein